MIRPAAARGFDVGQRLGRAVLASADRDLIPLLAGLIHAQDADVADVVMAAGVDAARDVQVQLADLEQIVQVVELALDGFGHRDGDGIGQRAEVPAGTGDDVGEQTHVGGGQVQRFQLPPEFVQARAASARIRFCSCETRSSPKPCSSASAATASIWSAVMSPGGTPVALSETVTAA